LEISSNIVGTNTNEIFCLGKSDLIKRDTTEACGIMFHMQLYKKKTLTKCEDFIKNVKTKLLQQYHLLNLNKALS
jgi:hypothetical protein